MAIRVLANAADSDATITHGVASRRVWHKRGHRDGVLRERDDRARGVGVRSCTTVETAWHLTRCTTY